MMIKIPSNINFYSTNLIFHNIQAFIRSCLQYRKEDRIDVFSLAKTDFLKDRSKGRGQNSAEAKS